MKTKLSIMLLSAIIFFSSPVLAGDSQGLVSFPLVQNGVFMFGAGTHNNKPACSIVADNMGWAFDAKTSAGKSMQALVMLAYALGKQVYVVGSGNCNDSGDREKPLFVYILG